MRQSISRASLLRGRLRGGPPPLRPPWALAEPAFLEACTRCDACRAACPEGILVRGSGGFPLVDFQRGECTFCGRCAAACEDGALTRPGARACVEAFDVPAFDARLGPLAIETETIDDPEPERGTSHERAA